MVIVQTLGRIRLTRLDCSQLEESLRQPKRLAPLARVCSARRPLLKGVNMCESRLRSSSCRAWAMRACLTIVTATEVVVAAGCGGPDSATTAPPTSTPLPAWIGFVSNAKGAARDPASVTYVSLRPMSLPLGAHATVRNRRTGATATTAVVNGGFDPIRIAAATGDSLSIEVDDIRDVALGVYAASVPASHHPVIVRTDPASGTAVPVRSIIRLVFSEPMAATSIAGGGVRLSRAGASVPGNATLVDLDQLLLEFVPDGPLDFGTSYDFDVMATVVDLDGEPLESAFHLAVPTLSRANLTVLTVEALHVTEYGAWSYVPHLRVAASADGGAAYITKVTFRIPGISFREISVCWVSAPVPPGTSVELFPEVYGDWPLVIGSNVRASSARASATILFIDANGDARSLDVGSGLIEPGPEFPSTYSGGTAGFQVC